jgi:iron(III) transport system ATP-binding protein
MYLLDIENISKHYGEHKIVDGLSFQLQAGTIACLLGPSGCGKTTVLRLIAGFDQVSAGAIRIDGQAVNLGARMLPPEQRHIGMVFQDYALFPHLTVQDNVGFGLFALERPARGLRIDEMLELVHLRDAARAYPHELSGGQQQRVALARALAPRPRLLMLDEPFSNLDVELRERLSVEVRDILKHEGTTAILVTHDQHEAFAIADEIGLMHDGKIQQWDTPYNLYHQPKTRFVADFIGQGVLLPGTVLDGGHVEIELGVLAGTLPPDCKAGCLVDVLLRPDDIEHDDTSTMQAEVTHKAFRGAHILYTLRLAQGGIALSLVPSHHNHALGEKIGIKLMAEHVVAFPRGKSA